MTDFAVFMGFILLLNPQKIFKTINFIDKFNNDNRTIQQINQNETRTFTDEVLKTFAEDTSPYTEALHLNVDTNTVVESLFMLASDNNVTLWEISFERFTAVTNMYIPESGCIKSELQTDIMNQLIPSYFRQRLGFSILILVSIVCCVLLSIMYLKFAKRQIGGIFNIQELFDTVACKKYAYIMFLIVCNVGFAVLTFYFGGTLELFIVIVVFKSKDIFLTVIQTITHIATHHVYPINKSPLNDYINGSMVSVIPVYSESVDQVKNTIDSIIDKNALEGCPNLLCIICDGKDTKIQDNMTEVLVNISQEYVSWKGDCIVLDISIGKVKNTPCILLKKKHNQGKRDSLILANDIFNFPRSNIHDKNITLRSIVREHVKELFAMTCFEYMFCTDADSIICEDSFKFLIESLNQESALAACGLVVTDFSEGQWNFWTLLQNFQYLYGQYVRRRAESIWGKVTCLPGCITMFRIHPIASSALTMYSELPRVDETMKSIVQLLGTDRRLTSSFLFQNAHTRTVFDDRAKCLTVPPTAFYTYLTQRRRWGSNSYFNTMFNIVGPNMYLITRFIAVLDYLRMSLMYFRVFNTVLFIYKMVELVRYEIQYQNTICYIQHKINTIVKPGFSNFAVDDVCDKVSSSVIKKHMTSLVPCFVILFIPLLFFTFVCLVDKFLRRMFMKLIIGYICNRICGVVLTFAVITNVFWNIGSTLWGANQVDQGKARETEVETPVEHLPPV